MARSSKRRALDRPLSSSESPPSWSERVAQIAVVCSSALTAAGVLVFIAGGLAHAQGSDVVAALVFGLPACVLFMYAARRVQIRDFARAAIVCIVAGLLTVVQIILVGLSAAYSDPCFGIAHCTRQPTFAFVALTGATIVFVLAGALGLVIGPVAIGFAQWRHGQRAKRAGAIRADP
jgi:hypothetical protein